MRTIFIFLLCLLGCSKEYSCEDCGGVQPYPPLPQQFVYYDFEIYDNWRLNNFSLQIKDKRNPDFWDAGVVLKNDTALAYWRYTGEFEVSSLIEPLSVGDTALFRYHFRWQNEHTYTFITDTIIK